MMIADLEPWWGPAPGASTAGLAKLTVLDDAERLVAEVGDQQLHPDRRVRALSRLKHLSTSLWLTTAARVVSDHAEAVRGAARSVLAPHPDHDTD